MVISISPKIYEKALAGDKTLCRMIRFMLSLVENERHELILEGNYNLQRVIESSEFSNYRDILVEVMERSEERYPESIVVRITLKSLLHIPEKDNPQSFWDGLKVVVEKNGCRYEYIDLHVIESYLGQKLRIFLENGENDGIFINQMCQLVKGKKLYGRLIEFMNGGGIGNLKKELKRVSEPTRVICFVDSDKKFPGNENADIKEIRRTCQDKDFHLHVLEKRMIENYLPEKLLKKWLKDNGRSEDHPYFLMNAIQRQCFHLKDGLPKKDLKMNQVEKLYSNLFSDLNITKEDIAAKNEKDTIIDSIGKEVALAFREICAVCSHEDLGDDLPEITRMIQLIDQYT